MRFWDHDLGPDEPHVLALDLGGLRERDEADRPAPGDDAPDYPAHLPLPVDLTPAPTRTLDHVDGALTPDGRTLVASVGVQEARGFRAALVAIDVATGTRAVVSDEPDVDHEMPRVSHDGRTVAWVRTERSTPAGAHEQEVWVAGIDADGTVDVAGARRIASDWDRWPSELVFEHGDGALLVTADQDGRAPCSGSRSTAVPSSS